MRTIIRNISILTAPLFFCSCRVLQMAYAEKIEARDTCQKIQVVNNQPLIGINIEGHNQVMLLDLGATASVLLDTSYVPGFGNRRKSTYGKASGAGRGKVRLTRVALSVANSIHQSANKMFIVFWAGNKDACSKPVFAGIYGKDFFDEHKSVYLLNFEKSEIRNLSREQMATALEDGYHRIKSRFGLQLMQIYITIDGKEYAFTFDTGFSGSFNIPYNAGLPFLDQPHLTIEGYQFTTLTGSASGKERYYEHIKVVMDGKEYNTVLSCSPTVTAQNVGVGFLKAFNWIIDTRHKQIYVKGIGATPDATLSYRNKYTAQLKDGRLTVRTRHSGLTDYNIGDEIIAVNGTAITEENKCEQLHWLNTNQDWEKFQVRTRPAAR